MVSGTDKVDVEGVRSGSAVGRSRGPVGLVCFTGLTRPVTPLATTWGCTPRKGLSSPIIPTILRWKVTRERSIIASEASEPPILCPNNITSIVSRGRSYDLIVLRSLQ